MKVSIPKADIEEIVRRFNCSQEEAYQAYLTAQSKAKDSFMTTLEELLSGDDKDSHLEIKTYTPKEIKHHLDKYVIGQEEYKKRICIAASYHFAMTKSMHKSSTFPEVKRFRKKNTIIAGPSGSGKTYCVEVLGDLLQVPTLIIDATDYTEAGYVGKTSDDMIRELIDMAPGHNRNAQVQFINDNGGIIFIDEMDKKAKEGSLIGHDISREGFQRSVLKLIERKLVPIDNPYSPASQIQEAMARQHGKESKGKDKLISTENILFILGGSFERTKDNLESIVKKRIEYGGRLTEDGTFIIEGFHPHNSEAQKGNFKNYLKVADADDFIHFGLLPELVGRTPIRTFVNLLSKNDLVRIMNDTEDSILSQYKMEFKLFDIDLIFQDEAIEYVAGIAQNKKTGARALVSVWEDILTPFQFELPGTNFSELVVTQNLCEHPMDMMLDMLEKSPFVDFIESFKKEYGIDLVLDDDVQDYLDGIAKQEKTEVSATIKNRLSGASALNYMNHKGPFKITKEMIDDPKYFDNLFIDWYKKQMKNKKSPPPPETKS